MATVVSDSDVIKMISSLSNWGRWGADDQLGTMNLISRRSVSGLPRSFRTACR
jgi:hypothetical protein